MAPSGLATEQASEPVVEPAEAVEVPMVQVEAGQWHSLEVLEEGTVLFEAKDGMYEALKEEELHLTFPTHPCGLQPQECSSGATEGPPLLPLVAEATESRI